jgi:hypothetical protein
MVNVDMTYGFPIERANQCIRRAIFGRGHLRFRLEHRVDATDCGGVSQSSPLSMGGSKSTSIGDFCSNLEEDMVLHVSLPGLGHCAGVRSARTARLRKILELDAWMGEFGEEERAESPSSRQVRGVNGAR